MATQPSSQISPATALAQLLKEHPHLPALDWTVPRRHGVLQGALYGDDHPFEVLRAYADVLGGSIRPDVELGAVYESDGRRMQMHRLSTRWRDVPVVVSVSVPMSLCGVSRAAGRLAEQRHDVDDPTVPADSWAVAS